MKSYEVNPDSRFPIYIHSLKNYDGDELLNTMKNKIKNEEHFNQKELLMISLLYFMKSDNDIKQTILNSALTITNIKCLEYDIAQFAKGIILILCDKFVED